MMRQIDHVRVALLSRGWSTPWELQSYILERWRSKLSDASITARIREMRQMGLEIPKRRRQGSRGFEYQIQLEGVATCRELWLEEAVDIEAALRRHVETPPGPEPERTLFDLGAPPPDDTAGRRPDGGRRR